MPGTGIAQPPGKRGQKIESPSSMPESRSPSWEGPARVMEESLNREKSPQGDWNTLEMWDKLRQEKD